MFKKLDANNRWQITNAKSVRATIAFIKKKTVSELDYKSSWLVIRVVGWCVFAIYRKPWWQMEIVLWEFHDKKSFLQMRIISIIINNFIKLIMIYSNFINLLVTFFLFIFPTPNRRKKKFDSSLKIRLCMHISRIWRAMFKGCVSVLLWNWKF